MRKWGRRVTGEILTWRQTAFQDRAANHRETLPNINAPSVVQVLSVTSHHPKLDYIFALYPLFPGSNAEADSQIKIARGNIQTLLSFCGECPLNALDFRG